MPNVTSFKDFGLHCIRQPTEDTVVIFVHGILSDGVGAWGEPPWPNLLSFEPALNSVGISVFTYQTSLTSRTYGIADIADYLREHLRLSNLLRLRNIVFVCHSMGGIVVRRFLVANQKELIDLKPRIGLFLIASPSLGSRDANMLSLLSFALQHTQAAVLRFSQANTSLDELHRDFRTLLAGGQLHMEGRELIEDRPITVKRGLGLWRQVVEPFSASQYFYKPGSEPFRVPGSDHVTIVKPLHSGAIQHLMLKKFILELIHPSTNDSLLPIEVEETSKALRAIKGLQEGLEKVVSKPEALGNLQQALFETRQYVKELRRGVHRDGAAELRLSHLWNDAGYALLKFDPELASLCWLKGHGWADERLWADSRFARLPVGLDDMLQRLQEAMRQQVDDLPGILEQARRALSAMPGVLDTFEEVRPAMATLLGQPPVVNDQHAVTQRITDWGNAVEFVGLGQTDKVTIEDLLNLPADERRTIEASQEGMNKLKAEFEAIIAQGRRTQHDEEELLTISSQMGTLLKLVLGVIETALGGPLQDHYAAQRRIAEYAASRASLGT
ncbi:alpha/beta fold hydrolase [Microvirga sp. BT688]|uniref:esterase/lipase family protein n=1 Tax=Microvirga sp. TaxID=1873136 RepID=UPI0016895D69|nr:alpha/beta fold hydrolase [Microvirga sp.]MBD2746697.1 alpha/beta fold hydrolase [Microvirga sp.]